MTPGATTSSRMNVLAKAKLLVFLFTVPLLVSASMPDGEKMSNVPSMTDLGFDKLDEFGLRSVLFADSFDLKSHLTDAIQLAKDQGFATLLEELEKLEERQMNDSSQVVAPKVVQPRIPGLLPLSGFDSDTTERATPTTMPLYINPGFEKALNKMFDFTRSGPLRDLIESQVESMFFCNDILVKDFAQDSLQLWLIRVLKRLLATS
jgi:hypothetical protein